MEKRALFGSRWLPYLLLLPQVLVTLVFFFLPAGQALLQSLLIQDPFGGNLQFVWFDNFRELLHDELYLAAETDLGAILTHVEQVRPEVLVVDSVQTISASTVDGVPGGVTQVKEVAAALIRVAKTRDITTILVGHVTKEGTLAGPRVLEHLVDCVLQFEGERERTYRTLRALKNRFGSTSEAGVFEMRQGGLVEVQDASARFVGEATRAPGSVVLAAMEGSRPLLVEVQATAERDPFSRELLDELLDLASGGIAKIAAAQEEAVQVARGT